MSAPPDRTPPTTKVPFWPAAVALAGSGLGLAFGLSSTLDYTKHLDRQVHDLHCSFIPGLGGGGANETACRAAMYSPYSAILKTDYWGGVPISLFAVGAFGFFAAFSIYLLLARSNAPRRAHQFFFGTSLTPLAVSIVMFAIAATRIGQFCKTCVGIYVSSAILAIGGIGALIVDIRRGREALEAFRGAKAAAPSPAAKALEKADSDDDKAAAGQPVSPTLKEGEVPAKPADPSPKDFVPPRTGGFLLAPAWLASLGICSVIPAFLYVSALPSYAPYVNGCGKLEKPNETTGALLHVTPAGARQQATLFVDPLCPTCKGFHQRLVAEGVMEKLDLTLVLFPLDNECNWMLDRPLHPGSCIVSKAVLCSEHRAMSVLEWAYDKQDDLLAAAKAGAGLVNVRAMVRERWPGLDACVDSKETGRRLDRMLRYIVQNQLPVSTPQLFLDGTRLCDEDSDIGLSYTLTKLAPDLVRK